MVITGRVLASKPSQYLVNVVLEIPVLVTLVLETLLSEKLMQKALENVTATLEVLRPVTVILKNQRLVKLQLATLLPRVARWPVTVMLEALETVTYHLE